MNDKWITVGDLAYASNGIVPFSVLSALARMQGRVYSALRRKERKAIASNLASLPQVRDNGGDPDRLSREFYENNQVRNLLLTLAPRFDDEELWRRFPIAGIEHLDRAIEQNRGVVLLGSHINSLCMFLGIIMLRRRGYSIRVPLPDEDDAWAPSKFMRWMQRYAPADTVREAIGGFYCQFNIRPIVKALKNNEIIAQTGDGWHSAAFVDVEFLGRTVPFTTGSIAVAQMTGSVVVPMFQDGTPPDGMNFVIEEGFTIEKGSDPQAALQQAVAGYVARLEKHLLANLPNWQHWRVADTLDTMQGWPARPLSERYHV